MFLLSLYIKFDEQEIHSLMTSDVKIELKDSSKRNVFEFAEIEKAFIDEAITLKEFAEVIADNFGKKKARKILRRNLEKILEKEGLSLEDSHEHLLVISSLI